MSFTRIALRHGHVQPCPFTQVLRAGGIAIEGTSEPKQTDTTQRWKVGLGWGSGHSPLPTKIEFSRRGLDDDVGFESVDPRLIHAYQLPPFMASHYRANAALRQKIAALANRRELQARDVFDIHHLIAGGAGVEVLHGVDPQEVEQARANALAIDFSTFKGQVLAFRGRVPAPDRTVRLIDALATLGAMPAPVFDTGDAAARLGVDAAHASTVLARLAATRHVVRLRRGVWAFRDRVDPLALPEYLTSPLPSYVSLQSALYLHGMIDQVPAVTYAVSLARTRRYTTPLGTVSIHHVDPAFLFGFEDAGSSGGRLATPEKALVDFLYLAPARSKLLARLQQHVRDRLKNRGYAFDRTTLPPLGVRHRYLAGSTSAIDARAGSGMWRSCSHPARSPSKLYSILPTGDTFKSDHDPALVAGAGAYGLVRASPGGCRRRLCYDVHVTAARPDVDDALMPIASATPGLQLLLLHGSRARNDAHAHSDWDFAYEADAAFDADALLAALADTLHADRIDLVDLNRAGALFRHRVARDGVVLFERTPGRFDRFWLNAVDTWCDLAPVLEPIYARVLEPPPG